MPTQFEPPRAGLEPAETLWMVSGTHYSALAGRRVGHLLAGRPPAVLGFAAFVTLLSVIALIATLVR